MTVHTPNWVRDAVFYQIFPDRFARAEDATVANALALSAVLETWGTVPTPYGYQGGNLQGIIEHLDYLADLGINAIYLNPIFSAGSNHRYNTFDYYRIDPLLGDNATFDRFLAAAHQRNIRVVLDGVFNHVGRGFYPFVHVLELGENSPYRDWFSIPGWPLAPYGPAPLNYATWENVASMPKLNTDTPQVREFIYTVAEHWLERGIDGWRLDVPYEIDDDDFWRTFRDRCKAVNPDAYIVGELWYNAERWLGGDQFDGQMNYTFTRAIFGYLVGDALDRSQTRTMGYGEIPTLTAAEFGQSLEDLFNQRYAPEIVLSQLNMLGSHDTSRLLTLANADANTVHLAFACQMTVPGAPNIYYGDEIGMTGRNDPYCRGAFPWDDESQWDHSLRDYVKQLIDLRHRHAVLRRGTFTVLTSVDTVIAYQRQAGEDSAVIAMNVGDQPVTLQLPELTSGSLYEQMLPVGQVERPIDPLKIVIAPRSVRILDQSSIGLSLFSDESPISLPAASGYNRLLKSLTGRVYGDILY